MSLYLQIFCIGLGGALLSCVLLVIFGQVTVRRLRRDPKLKDKWGIEFISGYDIMNVTSALTLPKWLSERLKDSPISFLYADYQALYEATKPFERVLARVFSILSITSIALIFINELLEKLGIYSAS